QMLADVHAASARNELAEARAEAGRLQRRSTALHGYVVAYELAHARSRSTDRDAGLLREQLNEELREQRSERSTLQEQREELVKNRASLEQERQTLRGKVDEAHAEARRLRDEAFVAEGTEHFELAEQARQAALRGDVEAGRADNVQGEIDMIDARLAMIDQRTEQVDAVIAGLTRQLETVGTQVDQNAEQRREAEADRDAALEALRDEYDRLLEGYQSAVRPRFEQARQHSERAVDQSRQAADLAASGSERTTARTVLLARWTDHVQNPVSQAIQVAALSDLLQRVADRVESVQGSEGRALQDKYRDLVEHQQQLVATAEGAIEQARELAGDLASESGDVGPFAQRQQNWLDEQLTVLRSLNAD
ncbi:MAG: hypothetical protein WD118_11095, partial [Phycisphaeraceae bacterium]